MKFWCAAFLWFCASIAATASSFNGPPRVNLIALGPDGARAVLTYNQTWVEVDLFGGGAQVLEPPAACSWTSMAYAPGGEDLAMSAFCAAPRGECGDAQALLLAVGADRKRYRMIAETDAARWSRLYWRGGQAAVLALETALAAPMATNLSDLGKTTQDCEVGAPKLVSLNAENGRRIHLDLAPREWRYKNIVAASDDALIAEIAIARDGPADTSAARDLIALCAIDPRHTLCMSSSVAVELLWQNGDWRFATLPDHARRGRMLASADLTVIGQERCEARWVEERFRPVCFIEILADGELSREITAPDGLFGDLAMSDDGQWLLAVSAGVGRRLKQFDLFNTATGARRAFPDLLTLSPPFLTKAEADR